MGTFAGLFSAGGSIPENRREEFSRRIEKLYQAGGMMEIDAVQLYGKKLVTIRKVTMHEKGMDFFYNYFEDSRWENAGFDKEMGQVWSGKIGGIQFYKVIAAAYVLEEIYTEGVAVATIDGSPITSWGYVGWINYLFDLKLHVKNYDPWKLFESFHDTGEKLPYNYRWKDFGIQGYSLIGGCEIYAVINGIENALQIYREKAKKELDILAMNGMNMLWDSIKAFTVKSKLDETKQLKILLQVFETYCEKGSKAEELEKLEGNLKDIYIGLKISDAPAFMIKAISEIYEKDFWELWKSVDGISGRKLEELYGNENYYILPISTQEFLWQSPDDMIPYWEKEADFEFSDSLWGWFGELKKRYNEIIAMNLSVDNPLKYVLDLMEEAEDNYFRIYTFTEFFEETIENLGDKKYLALWKMYEDILRDPQIRKAGDVIFAPNDPGYKKQGLYDWGNSPKRRLCSSWDMMELEKKKNHARVTLKRYMALVANKRLRMQVFGF